MKKYVLYLTLVLTISLMGGCQGSNSTSHKSEPITPIEAQITYSFVPDASGAHMFDINSIEADGSKQEVLLKANGVGFNQPDWTSDGSIMAIWGWHSPDMISIYTYNTNTQELKRLTDLNHVYDMFPHWNATNDKIVFTRQYLLENSRNEIWTINPDGTNAKKVADGYTGSWSPDGKQIVYSHVSPGTDGTAAKENNEDLYTCNSDGSNVVKVLDSPKKESFPMWSPNGEWIMFEQSDPSSGKVVDTYEICLLNPSTGLVKALTQNNYLDIGARWSPDGLKVAFLSCALGPDSYEIYTMNADGTDTKQVTQTPKGSFSTFPSWRVVPPYSSKVQKLGTGRSFGQCSDDFNGDGLVDVFVTTYEGKSELYFNTARGLELSPQLFSSPEDNAHDIACGDLDGDQDLDLFLVNNSKNSRVFLNDSKGNFEAAPQLYGLADGRGLNVDLADLDGDGDLDAVMANYQRPAQILMNKGKGIFETTNFEAFKTETIHVLVADFNGDKALDLYLVNQDRQDQIALNDGKGTFDLQPGLYGEAESWGNGAVGDVNGDGQTDVVVANKDKGTLIWLNDGRGNLTKSEPYMGTSSTHVNLTDLDLDGDLDLISLSSDSGVDLYHNDGLGNYKLYKTLETNKHAITSLVMDFDADKELDIIIGHMTGGNTLYYYK